jgi:hypothetical protein
VFVPNSWQVDSVVVGPFDRYPGEHRSDHVPVVVTTKDPPEPVLPRTRESASSQQQAGR